MSVFGSVKVTTRPVVKKQSQPKQPGIIAVDLDGTLATYDKWVALTHIGDPVPAMIDRVKQMLRDGYRVKIFTARCYGLNHEKKREFEAAIHRWTMKHIGVSLEATCMKEPLMIEFWDDRAIAVEKNTGRALQEL